MIEIGVDSEILKTILDGRKVIEGRLARGKFLQLKVGDMVAIREDFYVQGEIQRSTPNSAQVVVDEVREFSGFREMLLTVGHERVIPNAANLDEATAKYGSYYSLEDEREYGVLSILFHVVGS